MAKEAFQQQQTQVMPFISCQGKSVDLEMIPGAFSNYENMTGLLYI